MTPQEYFRDFVLPAAREYQAAEQALTDTAIAELPTKDAETLALRRAADAAKAVWHMADWMWEQFSQPEQESSGAVNLTQYRTSIEAAHCDYLRTGASCSDFNLIGTIADAFKHYRIRNPNREIANADAVGGMSTGWGEVRWGEGKWGGVSQVMVQQRDESKRAFSAVLQNTIDMWRRVLGLPLLPMNDFEAT